MEQQKFDAAKEAFELGHTTSPEIFAPRLHLGDLFMRQKKFAEARAQYRQLIKETDIQLSNERLRFAVLLTYLGEKDEENAKAALDGIKFPTEGPAYYYAQAAWAFAHDKKSDGRSWADKGHDFHSEDVTAWFALHLYGMGWLKNRPPLSKLHN